jgi:hypothetical protein
MMLTLTSIAMPAAVAAAAVAVMQLSYGTLLDLFTNIAYRHPYTLLEMR